MNKTVLSTLACLAAASAVLTAGCAQKTEDVRIKLCREITENLLDSMKPLQWTQQTTEFRRQGDAAIRLAFFVNKEGYANRQVSAACFFDYNQNEESAIDHVDPLFSYKTIPYAMTVEGTAVPQELLNRIVRDEQLEPFKAFLDQLKQQVGSFTQQ